MLNAIFNLKASRSSPQSLLNADYNSLYKPNHLSTFVVAAERAELKTSSLNSFGDKLDIL